MARYIEEGAFFCRGGLHRLADAIAGAYIDFGGELLLGCAVTKIGAENRAVSGVQLASGQEAFAPIVLVNMDCRRAFLELIEPAQVPAPYRTRLERLEPSIQAVDVSLATDLDLPALGFGFETLVFDNWSMEQVWKRMSSGDVRIFSLTITTAADPSLAPPGHHLVSSICGLPPGIKITPELTQSRGARLLAEIEKHIPCLADHLILAKLGGLPDGYITQEFGPIYG